MEFIDGFKLMPDQSVHANQEEPLFKKRAAFKGRQTARSSEAIIHEKVRIDTGGNRYTVWQYLCTKECMG